MRNFCGRGVSWNELTQCFHSISHSMAAENIFSSTCNSTSLYSVLVVSSLSFQLQMVVLMIKGILHLVINFLNTFPWYTLVKWLLGSATLKDQISFTNLGGSGGDGYSYCLNLQVSCSFKCLFTKI